MNAPLRRVVLSLGLLESLSDGLGEFCTQLVTRIAAVAPRWHTAHGVGFDVHLRPQWHGRFGAAVGYLAADAAQKRPPDGASAPGVWHTLHQHSRLPPPAGTACRMLTVHDLNYLHGKSFVSRWRYGRNLAALLGRTDQLVAISRHTAAELRRHARWRGPIEVIHNGARDLSAASQRPIEGVDDGRPFLFHLSRMSPTKNPGAILGLARAWPEMRFLLCGPRSADTEALERGNDLSNVTLRLDIDDAQKAWAYAHCAGFLFPSLTEGFGLPPIEAMYFGKPVFLSRLTALPEVGGDAAFYFDGFDPQAMRRVVAAGLAEAEARAADVRAHARRFDWDATARGYLALYARALGLPPECA